MGSPSGADRNRTSAAGVVRRRVAALSAAAMMLTAGCNGAGDTAGSTAPSVSGAVSGAPSATASRLTSMSGSASSSVPTVASGAPEVSASASASASPAVTSPSAGGARNTPPTDAATAVPTPTPTVELSTAAALPNCTPATLATRTPGVLTVATAAPPRTPWFVGSLPAAGASDGGKGLEPDLARAVAGALGFPAGRQKWAVVDRAAALRGTARGFDVFLDQVSDTDGATAGADLSTGYFSITDAVVVRHTDAAAGPPDLAVKRVGVLSGGTAQAAVLERGVTAPQTFGSPAALAAALTDGDIDVAVLPTPDALDITAAPDAGLAVLGQLAAGRSQPDQFHLVLAADSPLTPCVSAAVDRLRIEGTLDELAERWIGLPTLR